MSEAKDTILSVIENFASELELNQNVNFANQLSNAKRIASLVNDAEDVELIASNLVCHAEPHVRRMCSLAFYSFHFRWVEQVKPWIWKYYEREPFHWVRYDLIRFFYVNALLDQETFHFLERIKFRIEEDQVEKMRLLTLSALSEIAKNYSDRNFKSVEALGLGFKVPVDWLATQGEESIIMFESSVLESMKLAPHKYISSLKVQIVKNLPPGEAETMSQLNLMMLEDLQVTFLEKQDIESSADGCRKLRVIFYENLNYDVYPMVAFRQHMIYSSQFVVVILRVPLAHFHESTNRNLEILDSFSMGGPI